MVADRSKTAFGLNRVTANHCLVALGGCKHLALFKVSCHRLRRTLICFDVPWHCGLGLKIRGSVSDDSQLGTKATHE